MPPLEALPPRNVKLCCHLNTAKHWMVNSVETQSEGVWYSGTAVRPTAYK
jgi:hypothetical protein